MEVQSPSELSTARDNPESIRDLKFDETLSQSSYRANNMICCSDLFEKDFMVKHKLDPFWGV